MNWKFYYDESFHDGNITITKDGRVNIFNEKTCDLYTGFFIGYKKEFEEDIYIRYLKFEDKYKNFYGLKSEQELKNGVIHKKNYNNGFSSLNKQAITLYNDYFNIFDNPNIIINFCMFSKTELVVRELFKNISFREGLNFNREAFNFSITKFLFNYQNERLFKNILGIDTKNELNKCLYTLKKSVNLARRNMKYASRKKSEMASLKEVEDILENAIVSGFERLDFNWNYDYTFEGLNNLLNERNINPNDIDLFIDNHTKTVESANSFALYKSVQSVDSKNCVGVRISDFFCNFLGEIAWAINQAIKEDTINDLSDFVNYNYEELHLLPDEWFELNENQFKLCLNIVTIILKYHKYEWVGYDSIYCDYPIMTFGYMEYLYKFQTYESFLEIPPNEHSKGCNQYCLKKLNHKFKRAGVSAAY